MRRRVVTASGLLRVLLSATALAGLGTAMGCGPMEKDGTGALRSAIVYGLPSGPEDDSVVLVQALEPSGTTNNCTGTLVAPNLLLTARHCVSSYIDGSFTCNPQGELEDAVGRAGTMGDLVPAGGIRIRAGAVPTSEVMARGKETFALSTLSICRNDIALVVLDRDTDLPVAPLRLTTAIQHDELMRPVGYGLDEDGGILERRARDGVAVMVIGPSQYWPEEGLAPPRTFALGMSACQGDSGGPAFTQRGAVAGVYSLSAGECTSPTVRNYFTQVAPFEELVREAFHEAGVEPLLEPGTGVAGAAAAAGASGAVDGSGGGAGGPDTAGSSGTFGNWVAPAAGHAGAGGFAVTTQFAGAGSPGGSTTASHAAGAGEDAGAGTTAGASPSTPVAGLAGSPGVIAAAGATMAPDYHGPREKGGCRCGLAGAGLRGSTAKCLVLIGAFGGWYRERRRPARRRAGT